MRPAPLLTFFVLAFAVAWTLWIAASALSGSVASPGLRAQYARLINDAQTQQQRQQAMAQEQAKKQKDMQLTQKQCQNQAGDKARESKR